MPRDRTRIRCESFIAHPAHATSPTLIAGVDGLPERAAPRCPAGERDRDGRGLLGRPACLHQVALARRAGPRRLHTFAAHNGVVEGVAFSPSSALLATAGEDATAKLWNLATWRRLLTLRGHTGSLTALAFSPDGTRLATGSVDGTVRVYVLPIYELMAISRGRLTRGWTAAECARYIRGGRCPREP